MMNFTGDIKLFSGMIVGGHIFTGNTVNSHDSASHTPGGSGPMRPSDSCWIHSENTPSPSARTRNAGISSSASFSHALRLS